MLQPNFIMLYVNDPTISASFYSEILEQKPVELSPTFALFLLNNGYKFGLWSKHTVEPAASISGGGTELGFSVESEESVDTLYVLWKKQGVTMAQHPTRMDFGYTFVALDPDDHRLRVYYLIKSN